MSKQPFFAEAYGSKLPENYERFFVPAIGEPLARDLIRKASLWPGARVLDVACGTGIVARLAAQPAGSNGSVAGLDVHPGMVAVARSVTPADMSIAWYESGAEDMPLPDESFDVVLCQISLQFMTDQRAALREIRRVLIPGGRLFLTVPGPMESIFTVLARAMEQYVSSQAMRFVIQVFSLHNSTEIQTLLSEADFGNITVQADRKILTLPPPEEFLWQYVHSTPLSGMVAQVDEEARAAIERDVVAGWKDFEADGSLIYQQRIVLASAQK